MVGNTQIQIPNLVRIKPGALARLGLYLQRAGYARVSVLTSPVPDPVAALARASVAGQDIDAEWIEVDGNRFEHAVELFAALPGKTAAIVGIGGGKALDMAKYLAFLARLPYLAVPTSLSNDGFCSPQSSLTVQGKRRSLASAMPQGVIIDTEVCLGAPKKLWLSGAGDLAAKLTAVFDWKLAFHHTGEPVNDLAVLLSDATVRQFIGKPDFDRQGTALLGTSLMLNGIAMEMCGSSRPTSGSEHLISHALDELAGYTGHSRLHGLQVGLAAYVISRLQGRAEDTLFKLFQKIGFWDAIRSDPFSRAEWLEAVRLAPGIKENFFTVLSVRNCLPEVERMLDEDQALAGCFY